MTCNYYFKGNFIGNELQLADFLITKHKYFPQFKDLVFLLTERSLSTNKKLQEEVAKDGQRAHDWMRKYVSKHGVEYDSTGRVINLDPPAMGVNRFLQTYTHPDGPMKGHRIIPEFIKEEYWSRKINKDWPLKNFTEEEQELIKELEGNPNFDFNLTITKDTLENWSKKIQEKWDAQGKIGTALHAVSEMFFGKTGDKYNFEELEANPDIINQWYDKFKVNKDEYDKITFGDFVNFQQFKQTVEMCSRLKKQLEDKYGTGLTFYPEFTVASNLSKPFQVQNSKTGKKEECKEIMGIIDLLVVDNQGRTHIFDYKTSPKEYRKYSSAKERGFTYQLAVYDRMLQHYGIYTSDGSTNIIPIKLDGFRYDAQNNNYVFDSISYEVIKNSEPNVNIKSLPIKGNPKINNDLDEFLPSGTQLEVYSENLLEKVQTQIQELCPTYQQTKSMNDEQIRQMIEQAGGFTPNRAGELVFKFKYGSGKTITISPDVTNQEAEMFSKVKAEIESWIHGKQSMVEAFKDDFNEAVRNQTRFEFRHSRLGKGNQNSNYISELITPYCDGTYRIVENPAAMYLGVLMLENIQDETVTVLKLTGSKLDFQHEFVVGRTNMNGAFEADIVEDSKGNSLMLKSINANIEAIEAMLALQNMESNRDYKIREIKVINPYEQRGQPVSNKELLYTFKNLLQHKNVLGTDKNKFDGKNPKLQMLTDAERLRHDFIKILASQEFGYNSDRFNEEIRPEIQQLNILDWNNTPKEHIYQELNKLRMKLEQTYEARTKVVSRKLSDLLQPENQLYNDIMLAMAELKGVDIRQQIKDADNWLESMAFWKNGWEGLMLENSGNFKSPILNQLTKSISNVYQKVKDKVNRENVTVRKLVNALKKLKNFGWVRSNISGNQTDMYRNMTYVDADGDFMFVNPDTLEGAEREFLEHALDVINKNRWPSESQETRDNWKRTGDARYYRVPLMAASNSSKMSTTNFLQAGKERLMNFSPKRAIRELEEKAMGIFTDELYLRSNDLAKIYEMNNIFLYGEEELRLHMLNQRGVNAFEHNIETILLAHCYSYELRNQMTTEMPIIKASALVLSMQGAGANSEKGNFNNLIDFIENYVKGVIKNLSIVDDRLRAPQVVAGKMRKVASFLALAFSPVQFTYQSLEGVWKGCSLIIRKPDGTNAFTVKNMWEAAKAAFSDLFHHSDKPTKCQLLNEMYGLNDMDANQFTKRIGSDQGIWTHFTDFAFRFASRPDFYNRLTIWGAQMRNDGTWDAHEIVDGQLVYKFDKDKRYAALKTAPKGSPEYNAAMSNYLAALEQFKLEGVTNPDGSELKFGDDLPRAYTNKEAQGMKAIADGMYGYYNHENKSMFNSMLLGGLTTQMKTYWSAKKNQYLAPGGVKLVGKWQDYQEPKIGEDGNPVKDANGNMVMETMYYAVDDRGEIDLSKPFVREGEEGCSGVKVQLWKGQWQEGIILTYSKFILKWRQDSFRAAWEEMYNNKDVNLRTAYRSNIKHLIIDLFFMAIVGNACAALLIPWEEEKKKEFSYDQGDMQKACEYASASLVVNTVKNSFMDFNFIKSIFSPTMDWQPFAFSSLEKLVSNTMNYFTSDASFSSTLANSASSLRLAKPILKCIGYNED